MSVCSLSHLLLVKQKPAYELRMCDCSSDVCSSDLAFLALIYMLMVLQQEATAPFYATVLLLGINQFSGKHRMDWSKFKTFFFGVGILFAELVGILAAIGLIVGALSLTGMAGDRKSTRLNSSH